MPDRIKGAALARKFAAPKTVKVIEAGGCYEQIFSTAITELGVEGLLAALSQIKDATWAYRALHDIPDLTKAQRTVLKQVIINANDATWAQLTYLYVSDLTKAQRTALRRIENTAA
jgi:hypothetical protein